MKKEPVYYLQTNKKWAGVDYSAKGEKTNIGESGCGPTALAMAIAEWIDPKITPVETCAWALANGFKAPFQGTYYSFFAAAGKHFGLTISQLNGGSLYGKTNAYTKGIHLQVEQALAKGNLVIACMGKGLWTSSGHFILLWNLENGVLNINDPYSTRLEKVKNTFAFLQPQVKYYFIVEKPTMVKTFTPNYYAVESKYGFDANTMAHLNAYKFADSLFAMMLQDKSLQKYQVGTISYILGYEFGKEIFARLGK